MIQILHYLKDPKLWELWYFAYYGLYDPVETNLIRRLTLRALKPYANFTWGLR